MFLWWKRGGGTETNRVHVSTYVARGLYFCRFLKVPFIVGRRTLLMLVLFPPLPSVSLLARISSGKIEDWFANVLAFSRGLDQVFSRFTFMDNLYCTLDALDVTGFSSIHNAE